MPVIETDSNPVTPKVAKRNPVTPNSKVNSMTTVGRKSPAKSRSTLGKASGGSGKGNTAPGIGTSEPRGERKMIAEEKAPPPLMQYNGMTIPPPILEEDGGEDAGGELDLNVDELLREAEPQETEDIPRRMRMRRRRSSLKSVINDADHVSNLGVEGIDGSKTAEDEKQSAIEFRRKMDVRKIYSNARKTEEFIGGTETNVHVCNKPTLLQTKRCGLAHAGHAILKSTKKVLTQNRIMDGMWESNYKRTFAIDMMDKTFNLALTGDWEEYNFQLDEMLQNAVKTEAKHGLKVDLTELKQCALKLNTIVDDQLDAFEAFDEALLTLKEGEQRMRKDPLDNPESARDAILKARKVVELNGKRLADLHMLVLQLARGAWLARQHDAKTTERRRSIEVTLELFRQIGDPEGEGLIETKWISELVEGPLNSRMDEEDVSAFNNLSQRFGSDKAIELFKLMSLEMKGETMDDACRDELISEGLEDESELEQLLKDLRRAALSNLVSEAIDALAELTNWRSRDCLESSKRLEVMVSDFPKHSSEDWTAAPLKSLELPGPRHGTPEECASEVQAPNESLERARAFRLTRLQTNLELPPAENACDFDTSGNTSNGSASVGDDTSKDSTMNPSEASACWSGRNCSPHLDLEPESQLAILQARSQQRLFRRKRTRSCMLVTSKEAHEKLQKHATLIQAVFRGRRVRASMLQSTIGGLRTRIIQNTAQVGDTHDAREEARQRSKRSPSKASMCIRENGNIDRSRCSLRLNEGSQSFLRLSEAHVSKFPDDAGKSQLGKRLRHVHTWRQRGCGRYGSWLRNIGPVHGVKPALPQPETDASKPWILPSWRDKFQNMSSPNNSQKACLLLVENNVSPLAARIRRRCEARKVLIDLLPQIQGDAAEVHETAAACAASEIPPTLLQAKLGLPAEPSATVLAGPSSVAPKVLPSVVPSSKLWLVWQQSCAMAQPPINIHPPRNS